VSTSASAPAGLRYSSGYAARDVARLIGLTVPQIMGYVRAGCIAPRRGARREYRFSFQDLVLLRTARELMERMPARRVHRALCRLREQLPTGRQLTALRITAEGEAIVARDGAAAWNPESGQAVLDLDVASLATQVAPLARQAAEAAREAEEELDAEDWFRMGCDLEPCDPDQAQDAYRRALALDPEHADARLNLGRLLHEAGRIVEAEAQYRRALDARPGDATAAFNLGVALEDLRRPQPAVDAYERAIESDPDYADAHYNLARLWERLGEPQRALRHFQAYRRLAGAGLRTGGGTLRHGRH
jgi:tetratricopeptide (TPR) repeat protein